MGKLSKKQLREIQEFRYTLWQQDATAQAMGEEAPPRPAATWRKSWMSTVRKLEKPN